MSQDAQLDLLAPPEWVETEMDGRRFRARYDGKDHAWAPSGVTAEVLAPDGWRPVRWWTRWEQLYDALFRRPAPTTPEES